MVTFPVFFSFLFLYLSLKLKTQPIQIRDGPPFNLKGGHSFLLKTNNLMLNFEKKIYTHWPDRNAVLASRQCLLHITSDVGHFDDSLQTIHCITIAIVVINLNANINCQIFNLKKKKFTFMVCHKSTKKGQRQQRPTRCQ